MAGPRSLLPLVLGAAAAALPGCAGYDGSRASGGGSVAVQVGGEALAVTGFTFPARGGVGFEDGWELAFSHVLVTVGEVTLSADPDLAPADASRTGPVVARATGPWAVDLHRDGSVASPGGDGTAFPLAELREQNQNGGAPFRADTRYAVGFSLTEATAEAMRVGFSGDEEAEAAYAEMIDHGYSVLYTGVATFRGESCRTTDDGYDFSRLPKVVPFSLGFQTPTDFVNCQNQENQGEPFAGEQYQRGVAVPANAAAVVQVTLHLEHPFFSALQHDPALRFDQMAARLVGEPEGTTLRAEAFAGVDPTAFTDGEGEPLPARVCTDGPLPGRRQLGFETGSVTVDPSGAPGTVLRDYRDFVHYVQSTQGHLNGGEGVCFVRRRYPSPR